MHNTRFCKGHWSRRKGPFLALPLRHNYPSADREKSRQNEAEAVAVWLGQMGNRARARSPGERGASLRRRTRSPSPRSGQRDTKLAGRVGRATTHHPMAGGDLGQFGRPWRSRNLKRNATRRCWDTQGPPRSRATRVHSTTQAQNPRCGNWRAAQLPLSGALLPPSPPFALQVPPPRRPNREAALHWRRAHRRSRRSASKASVQERRSLGVQSAEGWPANGQQAAPCQRYREQDQMKKRWVLPIVAID